ncbi:hypothetical protein Zm00014a_012538 [Zea mays]|uniref:WW domain-containing protein n=2 Tax=Zea mays TaxID=4577 RepID=B4FLZ3_MAIZE|nr:uncharacterized protein LOC100217211 [Zea mays]ACF83136.1 unknown [Zea mays]AQK40562.1 hypothetical protein ZEAMMB73_Zm00001d024030 [Zea mays]PWZ46558.1 hypothetical protein Zm00014a_012538 [Zea mays]|eukprot:NP_001137040.1 uncharacterized LOC100217211 [Zea mays]
MNTEYLRVKKLQQEAARCLSLHKTMELQPELSLGPVWPGFAAGDLAAKSSSSESDGTSRKKRKHYTASWEEPQQPPASLELQLNDPLPLDWEQCLDLQSGRMYYLNRKTLKKSWVRPQVQSVNLDLNISTAAAIDNCAANGAAAAASDDEDEPRKPAGTLFSGGSMVAVPCANCHLLVMLCKSSPSCPNCKFVQPLAPAVPPAAVAHWRIDAAVKPLETLSLLH